MAAGIKPRQKGAKSLCIIIGNNVFDLDLSYVIYILIEPAEGWFSFPLFLNNLIDKQVYNLVQHSAENFFPKMICTKRRDSLSVEM